MSIKRLENEIAKLQGRIAEKDAVIDDLNSKLAAKDVPADKEPSEKVSSKKNRQPSFFGGNEE